MREGSLEAPIRKPIKWETQDFFNEEKLDIELRRVFDVCHGCRRCFNICESFPRLFDLIDESVNGELDTVDSAHFKKIVEACTLCDMCFMTKCPYVPPHEFDIDFPHLMLRFRAIELKKNKVSWIKKRISDTDLNGKLGCYFSGILNKFLECGNRVTRSILHTFLGIHKNAILPTFEEKRFTEQIGQSAIKLNNTAPAKGRKVVIYATCFAEYNNSKIGLAAKAVLEKNGVQTEVVYPKCCGMPQLEYGDLAGVAKRAEEISVILRDWIDKGYDIVTVVPSCTLMLKFEWPLILPNNQDVEKLSNSVYDITEYLVDISKNEGLAEGMSPIGDVTVHIPCHSRAQNIGQKGAEVLHKIPNTQVTVLDQCSGHGGTWGVMKENYEASLKVGKPVVRKVSRNITENIVSECPLARDHILHGLELLADTPPTISIAQHPIELVAQAYGLNGFRKQENL